MKHKNKIHIPTIRFFRIWISSQFMLWKDHACLPYRWQSQAWCGDNQSVVMILSSSPLASWEDDSLKLSGRQSLNFVAVVKLRRFGSLTLFLFQLKRWWLKRRGCGGAVEEEDDNLVLGLVRFFLSAVFFVYFVFLYSCIFYMYIYMCI